MRRRELLAGLAAIGPLTVAGRVWAAPRAAARLLVVFLRGAYDAANVVIPVASDFYYQARPTLAVPPPKSGGPDAAAALDADWGLHPALAESILPLWQAKEIAFVPFAGTDDLTRSHFETQDTIELGQPVHGARDYRSGFMNRLVGVLTAARPISFTDQLPLIFRGGEPVPNAGLDVMPGPTLAGNEVGLIEGMYRGNPLAMSVSEGFAVHDDVSSTVSPEAAVASRGAVSARGFEMSGRRIGRLMRERYNLGFVDVGGWDTHVGEGGTKGYLPDRLRALGRGVAAFAQEIGQEAWRETVVVVISEFGRTFRENGNRGTDHGHGSVYWVLGGAVAGGRMAGEQVRVQQATLFQNRDFPVLTDYRALFGGLLQRLYGLNAQQLATVFPDARPKDLGLV